MSMRSSGLDRPRRDGRSEGGGLNESRVCQIRMQLIAGLKYAHLEYAGQVVYRDLRPANILLNVPKTLDGDAKRFF